MTLQTIKEAIEHLTQEDQLALESWLAERWDAQIERDFSPRGAGMALLEEADAEISAGNARTLDEVLEGLPQTPAEPLERNKDGR